MNSEFYEVHAQSFSDTRHSSWPGWNTCIDFFDEQEFIPKNVCDIACGNARFLRFLEDVYGRAGGVGCGQKHGQEDGQEDRQEGGQASKENCNVSYVGIDNEEALLQIGEAEKHGNQNGFANAPCFIEADVLSNVLHEGTVDARLKKETFNLVCAFGFMHHVPSFELRLQFIECCLDLLAKEGFLVLTFWQFLDDPKLSEKSLDEDALACAALNAAESLPAKYANLALEENDYLRDWQGSYAHPRYCHYVGSDELEELAHKLKAQAHLVKTFVKDGRNSKLNTYAIFQKA